jgi:hypothetical protein
MVIANPIYDVVFKRLMENEKVVKFFIGTLLEEEIERVEVQPQEFTYTEELIGVALFRLDFVATIKTATGENKKILVEIQKARNPVDVMRFRNYLAEHYKKEDRIQQQTTPLPITTIYILGFTLPGIDSPCVKVERQYRDLVHNHIISAKSDFIEKLTHDSFVVQVERITDRYQSHLDKLLSLFEQRHFTDDSTTLKEFTHEADVEEVRIMAEILHCCGTEPEERKQLDIEREAWRTINAMLRPGQEQLQQELQELEEKDKELEEKDKELEEKDRLIAELRRKLGE